MHARLYAIIILLFTLLLPISLVYSQEVGLKTDGREYLRKGKADLDASRHAEAVKNLLLAQKEFSLLEDYALFYLSEAYHGMGEHGKSLETTRTLLERHPGSPLKKKARQVEIREARETNDDCFQRLLESYTKDYPDDEEILFMYALFLRESGDETKAESLLKSLYIRAGSRSDPAYLALKTYRIRAADLIERAANLAKRYEFGKAEADLRRALLLDDGSNRQEILREIGFSLFRQKKYKEAAEYYRKIDDSYFQARSLYRAGDKQGFDQALGDLLAKNDRRAGTLLLAVAGDKRRERDYDGALKIYGEVQKAYPSEAEEALWGAGWTHYVSGEYKKAAEVFSKLYAANNDLKYLYWQARSLEEAGESALNLYSPIIKADNGFYSFLSFAKTGEKVSQQVLLKEKTIETPDHAGQKFERVEALHSIGMSREAAHELVALSRRIESPDELIYVISKFVETGEYKRAVGFATKLPYSEKMHRFWYPLAFWDTIQQVSRKYSLDPFVLLSVIREESRFDPEALSIAGARGLMQLMPETAFRLDRRLSLGISRPSQLYDVKNNITLGTYYLKSLFSEFNSLALVLASYNAGEVVVRKWQQRGNYKSADEFIEDIPYPETRNYVKKVLTSYFQYKKYAPAGNEREDSDLIPGKL